VKRQFVSESRNKIFTVDCFPGHSSPLKDLEDTIVYIFIEMSQIWQPLTTSESLVFMNSLIQGTKFEHLVTMFEAKYCNKTMKETTKKGEVGLHFWQNFMQDNSHHIVNKHGERFVLSHADWSTYDNFVAMYDHIYDEMHSAGLTKEYLHPVLLDENGLIVDNVSDSYGLPVTHKVIHSKYLLFLDETDSNTNQKDDRHCLGGKRLCVSQVPPQSLQYLHWITNLPSS